MKMVNTKPHQSGANECLEIKKKLWQSNIPSTYYTENFKFQSKGGGLSLFLTPSPDKNISTSKPF